MLSKIPQTKSPEKLQLGLLNHDRHLSTHWLIFKQLYLLGYLCALCSTRAFVTLRSTKEGLSDLPTTGNPALLNIPVVPCDTTDYDYHWGLSDNVAYLGIQGVPGLFY